MLPVRSPLFKQIAGAVIGAAIAFILYSVYQTAAPHLGAYIHVFWDSYEQGASFSSDQLDTANRQFERQAQRNREIATHLAAPSDPGPQQENTFENIAERARRFEGNLTAQEEERIQQELEGGPVGEEPQEPQEEEQEWQQQLDETELVPYEGDEVLPDSGIGLWLGAFIAFAIALILCRKKKIA